MQDLDERVRKAQALSPMEEIVDNSPFTFKDLIKYKFLDAIDFILDALFQWGPKILIAILSLTALVLVARADEPAPGDVHLGEASFACASKTFALKVADNPPKHIPPGCDIKMFDYIIVEKVYDSKRCPVARQVFKVVASDKKFYYIVGETTRKCWEA